MRYVFGAILLAGLLAGGGASAQYMHHKFCLRTGSAEECAFDTLAQCKAGKHGATDSCFRNGPPIGHER